MLSIVFAVVGWLIPAADKPHKRELTTYVSAAFAIDYYAKTKSLIQPLERSQFCSFVQHLNVVFSLARFLHWKLMKVMCTFSGFCNFVRFSVFGPIPCMGSAETDRTEPARLHHVLKSDR